MVVVQEQISDSYLLIPFQGLQCGLAHEGGLGASVLPVITLSQLGAQTPTGQAIPTGDPSCSGTVNPKGLQDAKNFLKIQAGQPKHSSVNVLTFLSTSQLGQFFSTWALKESDREGDNDNKELGVIF